jgi:hypothetical protein
LDKNKKPLAPVHPAESRILLRERKAVIFRAMPFTIILKKSVAEAPKSVHISVDPGSRVTGLVLVDDETNRVVFAMELEHRGSFIKKKLDSRRAVRRSRRSRKCRHRQPRFLNRRKHKGWIAPSIMSRVHNIETWVNRFIRWAPVSTIVLEDVKFDMQLLENPEISGVEYQQGTLAGYRCCGKKTPLSQGRAISEHRTKV